MAQQVFGPAAVVSVLNRAFTNTSPSNSVFANQVATAGTTDATQLAFAKAFGAQYAVGKTAADLSALLMTNMGLDNALLKAALTDYIAANGTQAISGQAEVYAAQQGHVALYPVNFILPVCG